MYIQTNINEFNTEAPANELDSFYEECEIFGESRMYRFCPVFRTYILRGF